MITKDFLEYVIEDLMNGIDGITSRKMFGGVGLYKDGVIFGMIVEDIVYFKVDETNKPLYEQYKSKPFTYSHGEKKVSTSYWEVPADIMDDKQKLHEWLNQSYNISKNRKTKK